MFIDATSVHIDRHAPNPLRYLRYLLLKNRTVWFINQFQSVPPQKGTKGTKAEVRICGWRQHLGGVGLAGGEFESGK
jgi:hypothetical protein